MKVILVAGATGQQGGSVIRALSDSEDYFCLALTRNPESQKAQKLKPMKNVKLVKGDLNDVQQLRAVFEDAKPDPSGAIWGVFVALEYPGLGANADSEERQGKNIAAIAQEFGVESYIFSSSVMLPSPEDKPPIPGTDRYAKTSIEKNVASLTIPWTIVRIGFCMENFNNSIAGRFTNASIQYCMPSESKLQLTALDDVGRFSRHIFDNPSRFDRKTLNVATKGLEAKEFNRIFLQATGYDIPSVPKFIMTSVYWLNRDVRGMIDDFVLADDMRKLDPQGYDANIQEAASYVEPTTFEEWARKFNETSDKEVNEHHITLWGLIGGKTR